MRYLFITIVFLTACTKPAESSMPAGKDFEVEKLFTVDGCSAYRFMDRLNYIYFTNCNGSTQWRKSCGKNCTKNVSVD